MNSACSSEDVTTKPSRRRGPRGRGGLMLRLEAETEEAEVGLVVGGAVVVG
jgi:hypothetical protein